MYRHEQVSTTTLPVKLVVHTEYLESQNVLRHWHQALEVDYIIRGDAEFVISGQRITASSGDVIVINPNEIHSVKPLKAVDNHTLSLTFLFPYEFLHRECETIDKSWFKLSDDSSQINLLKQTLFDYYKNSQTKSTEQKFLLMSEIYLMLFYLFHYFLESKSNSVNLPTVPTLHKLSSVIDFINEHSADDLSLPQIAGTVHLSEGYLSRTFKEQMGEGVMEYVNLVRLRNAFEILTNTEKDIETISDLAGFANVKSFRRLFAKVYQTTPGKYRINLKGHKTT
ncbi:helix-turn-helix domain-containing protein [Companilactobacillus huachuanensis]|uniref:Helix-turn-helix domain-containing protein n=1 Tax=Companilactobacillus huachuanensis TaxID=2559914 RepID=A0ABW1RKI3_9LACO|nr:AraC family transcriptional regulator [Companilactobacillus huachuanensis]